MNWEEKQTKTQISKETCKQELLKEMKWTAVLKTVVAFIVLIGGIIFLIVDFPNWLFNIFFHGVGLFCLGLIAFFVYNEIKFFVDVKKSRIEIQEDTLEQIAVETVRRRSRHGYTYHEQKVFYFAEYGRYVTTSKDGSAFEYSNVGDRFYLLLYHGTIKPLRIYNAKVYEYRA